MVVERQRVYRIRDRFPQLRAFCLAARLGSITRAAQNPGQNHRVVSRHIRRLEQELEAVLFERGHFGLRLTEAGKRLYSLTEPLVEGMAGLFARVAEENLLGRVDIAADAVGATTVLPPYIKRFRDRYPGVRLRVMNRLFDEGMALLEAGDVEFVLGARKPLEDMLFQYREMLRYDTVLITSLDHALAGRETVTPQEAVRWPMVAPPAGTYSGRFGERAARRLGVRATVAVEVRDWRVITRYVERGFGISVVPSICLRETDRVSVISLADAFPAQSFGVYTRRSRALTAPARRLLELMIAGFARESARGGEVRR